MRATKLRMAARWGVVFGSGILIPLAALCTGGCHDNTTIPMITGNHGGLFPGQILPDSDAGAKAATQGYLGETHDETLSDGEILRTNIMLGALYAREWFTAAGRPEHAIYYENNQPAAQEDYDENGQLAHKTMWFPGTGQVQRIEDYQQGSIVVRYAMYWPNGNLRVVSESEIPTAAGPVNRVRRYYENGHQESLVQRLMATPADNGGPGMLQGEQTEWDEKGFVVSDFEYDHDILILDHLAKPKLPGQ
jgi:antitoxin component YwqK of YwqJK toxin-antitoxin module